MIMVRDWSTCAWSITSVRYSLDFLIRLVGCVLNKQLEDLRLADERGHYTSTWNIIHSLSGRNIKTNVKVKLRNGDPPENEEHLLEEWNNYFSSLLNNDSGFTSSELPLPASNDLPICTDPIYLFIYRFVQCTGETTIAHVVPYLVHPPNPTP